MKFGAFLVDVAHEVLGRRVDTGEVADEVLDHPCGVVDLASQGGEALFSFPLGGCAEVSDRAVEQVAAVCAEDVGGEELVEFVDDRVFANPEAPGSGVAVGDVSLFRFAHVVGVATAGLAVHAPAAVTVEQVGAQQVRAFGLGMLDVGVAGAAGTEAVSADVLGFEPVLQTDERFVNGLRGPDPFLDGVGAVAAGLAALAVPDHVPGVLGVGEDVAHVRIGPAADGALRVDGYRRWIGCRIEVEPVRDGLVAEAFGDAPVVCHADGGCLRGVEVEERLLDTLGALGGDRVRDVAGAVAVARFPDVVSRLGVDREAVPGLLQHVDDVELGNALLDPAGQQRGGDLRLATVHCGQLKGLIGREQTHPGTLQAVLDGGAVVHVSGGPFDGLADDVVESPIGTFGLGEQVLDAAVTGDRNVELFMRVPTAAGVEVHAPGFDVVEVRDDQSVLGQRALR
nr:hypothetical protein [Saccharomonospora marina]